VRGAAFRAADAPAGVPGVMESDRLFAVISSARSVIDTSRNPELNRTAIAIVATAYFKIKQ